MYIMQLGSKSGRAMTQAVSRWHLTVEAVVRFQFSLRGICYR
jgi:phage gp37-like protein